MYTYEALVTGVYDGDSITVTIYLGFGIEFHNQKIRLARINTPELRGEERESGLISRDALREKILHKQIIITTFKDKKGKYGRYIGDILIEEKEDTLNEGVTPSTLVNINDWLVENGYGEYKTY
jgi:micrococcal nuclease